MNKRQNIVNTVGVPSLFLIFAILCMVILSLLTLGVSRSDLHTSQQAMEQTTAYYEAGGQAADLCQSAELLLEDFRTQAENEADYWEMVSECFSSDDAFEKIDAVFSYDSSNRRLSIQAPVSDVQKLCVEADILYAHSPGDACLNILTWKAKASDSWNPDMSLHTKGEY